MKARPIPGLEPSMPLAQAAQRIVAARVDELYSFIPAALDAENGVALHDMRIAAKRLRYALELVGFTLGGVGEDAAGTARDLQRVIGEIHDHDVLLERAGRLPRSDSKGARRLRRRLRRRRSELFDDFSALWAPIEASTLRERLREATTHLPSGLSIGA